MKWTEAQVDWLRQHYASKGAEACAAALGKSKMAVFTKACRAGIATSRPWRTHEVALLRDEYHAKGLKWCAERLGRSKDAVASYARQHGFARKREQKAWTQAEVDALQMGGTPAELAARLGRTVGSVRMKIAAQRMNFRRYRR